MDLSVIIVNWNVSDLLKRCLWSIFQNTDGITFEVFVVDNASADDSVEMVRTEFPQVHLIANRENAGFARANNQGLERAVGAVVLLLNPDTEMVGNTLGALVRVAKEHESAGVIGGQFFNPDGTLQPSVRRFPKLLDHLMILLKLHHLFPGARALARYLATDLDPSAPQTVEQVSGTFMGITRAATKIVGVLDERFFIWYEDVDYCKRVRAAGLTVLYTPEIKIINHGGKSFAKVVALKKQKMMNRSMGQYFKKHHARMAWLVIQSLRPLSLVLTWWIDMLVYRGRPASGVSSEKFKKQ